MKIDSPGHIIVKLIAAGLLLGALGRLPYAYYTLLRWVVCGVSAFASFQAATAQKSGWAWTLAIVALMFNPLVPVHLNRETWSVVDVGTAILLLISVAAIDRHAPKQ